MDGLRKIKFKRAIPGVVAGTILCAILLFVFYSMTPDQRVKRTLGAVFDRNDFVQVGERTEGLTTNRDKAFIDVYESPVLSWQEIERLDGVFRSSIGNEYVEPVYTSGGSEDDYRTYFYTVAGLGIAEIKLVPVYTDDEGDPHTRLIVSRHIVADRSFWSVIFG